MPRQYTRIPVVERFWGRVQKSTVCWTVLGPPTPSGYGVMTIPNDGPGHRSVRMSHVAWFLATGHWPSKGELICHNCPGGDDPACVRNDDAGIHIVDGVEYIRHGHLWLGDAASNQRDMVQKGRSLIGDKHPRRIHPDRWPNRGEWVNSKLSPDQVNRILAMRGKATQREIASIFGVHQATVHRIFFGKSHVFNQDLANDLPIQKRNKLTIESVRVIRARHALGDKQSDIAADLGLGRTTVHAVISRQNWADRD